MEITQTTLPEPRAAARPEPTSDRAAISSDFETFLLMLTTQMQNQDPLNPLDSSDFAVQLATFSGVEQQVQTNDLLAELGTQLGLMSLSQLSGWVGMEARSTAPRVFQGDPVTLDPQVPAIADAADLLVRNTQGVELFRLPLAADVAPFAWHGLDDKGVAVPHGAYSFAVQPFVDGIPLDTVDIEGYSKVVEVRQVNGRTELVLEGGVTVEAAKVSALRDTDATPRSEN